MTRPWLSISPCPPRVSGDRDTYIDVALMFIHNDFRIAAELPSEEHDRLSQKHLPQISDRLKLTVLGAGGSTSLIKVSLPSLSVCLSFYPGQLT